jgi:hypothetical protein
MAAQSARRPLFNALIRTHHITSRKKVTALSQAAKKHDVYALLRSGSTPGIMYAEGDESAVAAWVGDVKVSGPSSRMG